MHLNRTISAIYQTRAFGIIFAMALLSLSEALGVLFNLDTQFDSGRYTYTFTDSNQPVAFAAFNDGNGGISFNVADATNIIVPEGWTISYHDTGFGINYYGPLPGTSIGYVPIEVSFDSDLSFHDIDLENPHTSPLGGVVYGTVVLENTLGGSGHLTGSGSGVSNIVGFEGFVFGVEQIEQDIVTKSELIVMGFNVEDLVPVAAEINIEGDFVCLELGNIIGDVVYYLEYRASLTQENWVRIHEFTSNDLDENNCIRTEKIGLTGYYRVVMPDE